MLVVCEPGVYQLQTGQGPLGDDPGCGSSHCEQLQQPNLATLVVVRVLCPQFPIRKTQDVPLVMSSHESCSAAEWRAARLYWHSIASLTQAARGDCSPC